MKIVMPEQLALAQDVDFENGCEFIDGVCRNGRIAKNKYVCCTHCARYAGYFRVPYEELPEEYKAVFDPERGFLGENGCMLPKEKRSVNCICFACINCNISDEERSRLEEAEKIPWQ